MMSFNIPAHETSEERDRRIGLAQTDMIAHPPTDVGSGIQAVANALMLRQQQQNAAFPTAPDGAKPDWGTRMGNLFTLGHNGGLY